MARKKKKTSSLGEIRQWMKDHESEDKRRFDEGSATMTKLATKDDLSLVMLDQASKKDLKSLSDKLLDEHGEPLFATREDMEPLMNLYKGSTFVKSFAMGTATLIITLAAVGYALISLLGWFRGH